MLNEMSDQKKKKRIAMVIIDNPQNVLIMCQALF